MIRSISMRDLSRRHTCLRFTDRTTPYWILTILPTLQTTSTSSIATCVLKKCRWDRFQILCKLFFTVFINIPNAFLGSLRGTLPRQIRGEAPFHSWISSTLRPKEEMTIVLFSKDYRCYRRILSTKTHEFAANLLSSKVALSDFLCINAPLYSGWLFPISQSKLTILY